MTIHFISVNAYSFSKIAKLRNALLLLQLFLCNYAYAQSALDLCLLDEIKNGHSDLTVAEIRERCENRKELANTDDVERNGIDGNQKQELQLSYRTRQESETQFNEFVITPHKKNYALPVTVTSGINQEAYSSVEEFADNLEDIEAKFQISLKVPLNRESLLVEGDGLYLGFTLQAWWQVYVSSISKPFRETNYQPELFYLAPLNWSPFGGNTRLLLGAEHQSNGRSQVLSRSWNRVYTGLLWEKDNMALLFRPWYRIPEEEKEFENDPRGDDNPDIDEFLGHFELSGAYDWEEYEFTFLGRQNFATHKGALELGLTFPLWGKLRGFATAFTGYGESLIDYNHKQTRFGVGVSLNNVL
ncbi:phospholipase A [Alteromonas sp. 5E99-2]|uniref:phospholipase A n=1 Tax=Alteromonas sp. 5E99-2 TaxID=2817683 RepID=UPI001A988958|nr:phospholipase A [Alteromonas sp. 5E99-2]MBO1256163.1 phospholipase A [Alteromonas sp. 5E99-2]